MYLSKFCTSLNTDKSLEIQVKENGAVSTAHIKSWEDGLGIISIQGNSSFDVLDQEMTLLNKAHDNDQDLPIHDFVKSIPNKYQKIAIKQISQQYSMLRIFRYVPAAYDLYHSNRLLLCLVVFHQKNLLKAKDLLKMPQHKIVEILYPNKESALSYKSIVRMLKHRIIDYGRLKDVVRIHHFLANLLTGKLPCYNEQDLLHIKYIPTYILNLEYFDFMFLLNPLLIFDPIKRELETTDKRIKEKISNENNKRLMKIISLVQDTYYMFAELKTHEQNFYNKLHNASNLNMLNKLHDEIMEKSMSERYGNLEKDRITPDISNIKPPISGTKNIIPLRSYSDYINESKELKHCLAYADYIHDVNEGRSYIYSVKTKNDRCTLELGIKENNEFCIAQLLGYGNSVPLEETTKMVNKWLAN